MFCNKWATFFNYFPVLQLIVSILEVLSGRLGSGVALVVFLSSTIKTMLKWPFLLKKEKKISVDIQIVKNVILTGQNNPGHIWMVFQSNKKANNLLRLHLPLVFFHSFTKRKKSSFCRKESVKTWRKDVNHIKKYS